jgi:glycerol-3-phosphate acyltransferase PlsY
LPVGATVIFVTCRASLGSIAVALILPALTMIRAGLGVGPWEHVCYGLLTSTLTLWALRPNIGRLVRGDERRVDLEAGGVRSKP